MSPVVIAVGVAMDPACGIAKAEFPAAFIIAVVRAELCTVECGKQPAAASLASDCRQRVLRRCRPGRGILCWIGHARAGATIRITDEHTAKLVDRNVIKVEQVAARIAAAAIPDAATLHRVRRSCIRSRPGPAAVISEGHVKMPDAEEIPG